MCDSIFALVIIPDEHDSDESMNPVLWNGSFIQSFNNRYLTN